MIGLLLGAVLISFSSPLVLWAGAAPDVVGFYRLMGGGLGLLALLVVQNKLSRITPHVLKWGLLAALFYTFDFIFWHRAIFRIGPGLSTMLGNFQVIVLSLVSVVFFKEAVRKRFYLAMVLALVGLYLMVGVEWGSFTPDYRVGVGFGLLTAVFYGLYLISMKASILRGPVSSLAMATVVALGTGVGMGICALIGQESFVVTGTEHILALACLALVCHAGGWYLITNSMQTLKGSVVGLILLLQPVLSFIWDILFFGKRVDYVEISGVVLALVAIYIGSQSGRKKAAHRATRKDIIQGTRP